MKSSFTPRGLDLLVMPPFTRDALSTNHTTSPALSLSVGLDYEAVHLIIGCYQSEKYAFRGFLADAFDQSMGLTFSHHLAESVQLWGVS